MGKTARVTGVPLLNLVLLLLLLLSFQVAEASPGHLVHKFYKNQIQREEVSVYVISVGSLRSSGQRRQNLNDTSR